MIRVLGRMLRREGWLMLGVGAAVLGAANVVSTAWLRAIGVVRVFTVARVSGNPFGQGYQYGPGYRMFGVSTPSALLTGAYSWGLKCLAIGLAIWILRLARRTADYRIGGLRTLGLFMPLIGVAVLAGALHRAAEATLIGPKRDRVHVLITSCCALGISALLLDAFVKPGFGPAPQTVYMQSRAISAPIGATVALAVAFAIATAMYITYTWQRAESELSSSVVDQSGRATP